MPELPRLDVPYGDFMPEEYSNDLFQNLESQRQRQEEIQMKDYMEGINSLGKLHTGTALKGAMDTVLGPSMERRNALIGGIAREGVGFNRQERLGDQQYGRQQADTLQSQGFQEKMQELQFAQRMREMAAQQAEARSVARKGKPSFGQSLLSFAMPALAGFATGGLSQLGGQFLPSLFSGGQQQQQQQPYRPYQPYTQNSIRPGTGPLLNY